MYRSYQKIDRRKSRVIHLGNIKIGGGAPISVQTMTNTMSIDVEVSIPFLLSSEFIFLTFSRAD